MFMCLSRPGDMLLPVGNLALGYPREPEYPKRKGYFIMTVTTTVFQWIARIVGVIILILGITIWTGSADFLIPIHMLLGITIVLTLWILAVLAAISGVSAGLVALAFVWGLIVLLLGLTQTQILPEPNPFHWTIQVAHLLIGLGAIGQAENLARRIKSLKKLAIQRTQPA